MPADFTFRGSIEHWRPVRNRNSKGIYDLLGREYPSIHAIPTGTLFLEGGVKKTRIEH